MKRWAILGIAVVVVIIFAGLSQTAISPRDFSGQWYSWEDQNLYVFQDGLIYCTKHPIPISGTESISGAYTYCRNSVVLFAAGIPGLEREKELYLVQNGDVSCLSDHREGKGTVYFVRYHQES